MKFAPSGTDYWQSAAFELLINDSSLWQAEAQKAPADEVQHLLTNRQRLLQILYPSEFGIPARQTPWAKFRAAIRRKLRPSAAKPTTQPLEEMLEKILAALRYSEVAVYLTNANPKCMPGGSERYLLNAIRYSEDEHCLSPLIIYPQQDGEAHRLILLAGLKEEIMLPAAALFEAIAVLVRNKRLSLHSLHLQHCLNWQDADLNFAVDFFRARSVPATLYFHDYYLLCTQPNLLFNRLKYCGLPEDVHGRCKDCEFGEHLAEYRKNRLALCEKMNKLIAPSEVARDMVVKIYPTLASKIQVIPHLLTETRALTELKAPTTQKPCIVFLGATGQNKGIKKFSELIMRCGKKFRYATVGIEDYYCDRSLIQHCHYNFHENTDLTAILEELKPAVAFLCSNWPETFSYTVHECMAAGLAVVTTAESGNIARVVEQNGNGKVFEDAETLIRSLEQSSPNDMQNILQLGKYYSVKPNELGLREIFSVSTGKS